MIKALKNSNNLSSWYYDSGTLEEGNGTTFASPLAWQLHATNNNQNLSYISPDYGNYVYVSVYLNSGVNYSINISSMSSLEYILYSKSDPNTAINSFSPLENYVFSFSVPTTGEYILKAGFEFMMTGEAETASITPAPNLVSVTPSWKRREIARSKGIDEIGYLLEYQSIEDADIFYKLNNNDEYSKLFLSFDQDVSDSAKGNEIPLPLTVSGVTVENGFGVFNNNKIDCSATSFDFANNSKFTVDFYINFGSLPTGDGWNATKTIFATSDVVTSDVQNALRFGNSNINFQYTDGNWIISTPMTMTVNKWYHFALVRNGNEYYMFINGLKVATANSTYTLPNHQGCQLFYEGDSSYFVGKIKNFNMSFGIARYVNNFTPLPVQGITL